MRSSVLRKSDYSWRPLPRALGDGLDLGRPTSTSISRPAIAALAERFAPDPPLQEEGKTGPAARETQAASPAVKEATVKGLISALVGVALIPTAILFVLLWRGMMQPHAAGPMSPPVGSSAVSAPSSTASAQSSSALEVALSSPDRIEAKAGEEIDFPVAIDATESLPSRSVIAVSGLPDGATFSEGRPYGATGWSLRPDEIGELRLRLPQGQGATSDVRLELLSADGTVLADSETRLNVAPSPPGAELVSAIESNPFEQSMQAEAPKLIEALPPPPRPKPAPSARIESSMKVAQVKTIPIKPPAPTRPHDGAYALGEANDDSAEWVEIVQAVDMHADPKQTSETVKVLEKGVKLRVAARDKNWVQVTDPATSANGWIYSRFLQPTEPPAQ
jgi:hypothetical protein